MLPVVVMIVMVGIVVGAVARELAPQPHPAGDLGPWLFALAGSAIGGTLGLLLGGGDPVEDTEQALALAGSVLGAGVGAAAFMALAAGRHRSVVTNDDSRQRATPVSGRRNPQTGAIDGS